VPELRQPHVLVVVVGTNAGILENTQLPEWWTRGSYAAVIENRA
jgi:hypothetical protein